MFELQKNTEKRENNAFIKMWKVWPYNIKICKEEEASKLLSILGIKTPLSKTPLVGFIGINKLIQNKI